MRLGGALLVGLWVLAAPRSFDDDVPGAGRTWAALDGRGLRRGISMAQPTPLLGRASEDGTVLLGPVAWRLGSYNEHLVRDVGGLDMGQAFVVGFALVTGPVLAARAAAGAALVFGVPHLLDHTTNTAGFEAADVVAMLTSLTTAAGLVALAAPTSTPRSGSSPAAGGSRG